MATSTVEDYLKCVLVHEQDGDGDLVSMGQIGASLKVAPGTVTAMMKTLSESELVTYEPYSGVRLTGSGRKLAAHVLRRHRLIEQFLVKVLEFDWSEVHDEAERLEHAVSDRLIERIDEMLGFPAVDPHGDPIPTAEGHFQETQATSLLNCAVGEPLEVVRVLDQNAEFLRLLERDGLTPGREIEVVARQEAADRVHLKVDDDVVSLGTRAASKIFVRAPG